MSNSNESGYCKPLALLVRDLGAWIGVLRRCGLRRRGEGPDDPEQDVRASDELERFREPAKAIIVWLELRGRDADAAEVDDAMASLREMARQYDASELQPVLGERADEHLSPLELLIQAVSEAAGRLENLDARIPLGVWQGFDDA